MKEVTLAIIKPDAVRKKIIGKIIDRIEQEKFNILGLKMLHLAQKQAEEFYDIHKGKSFFEGLIEFMVSGVIVVLALQKEGAVSCWRVLMGETDPSKAKKNTLRALYGTSIGENVLHGSDSLENAKKEVAFFFPELQKILYEFT